MTTSSTSRRAFACLLAACAALLAVAPGATAASARHDRVERAVLQRLDAMRADAGLRPLRPSRALARAADAHSRDMLAADFFAHTSSDGRSMVSRLRSFRPSRMLGEVLAFVLAGGGGQARTVAGMWRASPPHLATIRTGRFRRVGIARRTGTLGGVRVTVFTADFASAR